MGERYELISAAEKIGATFEALLEEVEVQDSGEARLSACLFLTIAELYIAMLRVVSGVAGQQVSLIDFGDEDGEVRYLKDRVARVAN
ncbi:MAG: hypothetical protein HY322_09695 [Betaproteobacteria bacterium]|nr:hypothetical protein [Betaproteobacteria bacterium]